MIDFGRKVLRRVAAEVQEYRRWAPFAADADVRMYYGFDQLPTRTDLASGGIIKCLDLAETWPNSPKSPNVLYLVSSALPERRALLTRAAQRTGGKVVLNQNGVAYPGWAGASWQQQNKPNAWVHGAADYVVYQSRFCRDCAERFLGVRQGPGRILYNPVDTAVFTPAKNPPAVRPPMLLVAGSHHAGSRVQCAIEALALVREHCDARLTVAGRMVWGPDTAHEAAGWAEANGVANFVHFTGPYTQQEAPGLFRSADVLVHLKYQDPCPRLVVEAMACGLPVVYSATGGTPELAGDEAGIGIPGETDFDRIPQPCADQAADAILKVLREQKHYAAQARSRAVRLFSVADWLAAHREILHELTG